MASRKFYAYYIRGGDIAIIEYDSASGSGQTLGQPSLDDISPGGGLSWKSPTETVSDGLEIEYTYSPRYTNHTQSMVTSLSYTLNNEVHYNGWTVHDGYLTLLRSDGQLSEMNALSAGSSMIVISGSERWNGVHKVQEKQDLDEISLSLGHHGGIKTYTKVNEEVRRTYEATGTWNVDNTITNLPSSAIANTFVDSDTTPFLWIVGADGDIANNGLFSGWTASGLTTLDLSSATKHSFATVQAAEESTATPNFSSETGILQIMEAFLEPGGTAKITRDNDAPMAAQGVNAQIDLPEYLCTALVYYVKAKIAEDGMDIDQKVYYMKEFYRIIEKQENSKIRGPRMVVPGQHGIR